MLKNLLQSVIETVDKICYTDINSKDPQVRKRK
jgi:hypothetical protein